MINEFLRERKNFSIFNSKIQISSCSQSALHKDVKAALNNYIESWENEGMDWEGWMRACENSRIEFAKLINADVDEIAIVSSVSHAVSAIAASLEVTDRNNVLVTDFDFPTVGNVWNSYLDKYNVNFIDDYEDEFISYNDYSKYIDSNTFLVNTSHVSFYTGHKQDLKKVSEVVHNKGAYLFVDAYQAVGQTKIDVKEMDIDFLTAGAQKYALGIPGIAFLYVKKNIAQKLTPKITGWFGQKNPFLFDIKDINYGNATKRFDSGTFPMINGFAAEQGLRVLNRYDVNDIEKHLEKLSAITLEKIKTYGLKTKSPKDLQQKGSNTAIIVDNAAIIEKKLGDKGIIASARNDVIRFAPHFYNTEEDIDKAVKELIKILNI